MVLPLSVLLCIVQSATVILSENLHYVVISSTLIAVIGFAVLLMIVLAINPLIRIVFRGAVAPFNRVELVTLFAVIMVTSGIPTFGLASQLVPIIPTPWNPEWNTPQRGWDADLLPYLNPHLYITDADQVRLFREGVPVPRPSENAEWGEKLNYFKDVFNAIPWSVWFKPVAYWMIFVIACYGMFYFLSYVVVNFWSQREKLIFPLAQLPESLLPDDEAPDRWWPKIFHSPVFWFGFVLAAGIISWNACVAAKWVVGLNPIPLGMSSLSRFLVQTPFEGLTYITRNHLQLSFGFVAIGIAFLLPLEISFSIWFYFLVGQAIILIGSWMNYTEFPSDWLWFNNPVSGLGAGGLLLFSAVSLYRSAVEYIRLGSGKGIRQRIRLALPVVGLVVCIAIVTAWLMWNSLSLFWALLFIGITTLVTLGVMRVVAEGGIYWIQSHVSFFHVYKMLGLGKFLNPVLLGPLLPIYWVLFLDIKTFMAPNLLNAAKMQQDVGANRTRFHVTVLVGILSTVVISLGLSVFLAYMRGAQQMGVWFYTNGPQGTMDKARTAIRAVPEFHGATTTWYVLGALWVALSMLLRQVLFRFPHPIGFIMQINPLIGPVWLSFFIAWICKKIVVKYGGKDTYEKVRVFFIGLIIGELMAVFVWPTLGVLFDFKVPGIHLNE